MRAPSDLAVARSLVVGDPVSNARYPVGSYLPDGRRVAWAGPARGTTLALDAELADRLPPASLARRFGAVDFWERWTRVECAVKLTGVGLQYWIRRHGLEVPDGLMSCVTVRPVDLDPHLVVSVGWRDTECGDDPPVYADPTSGYMSAGR